MRAIFIIIVVLIALSVAIFGAAKYSLWFYLWLSFFRPQDWVHSDFLVDYNLSYMVGALFCIKAVFVNTQDYRKSLALFWPLALVVIGGIFGHYNALDEAISIKWLGYFLTLSLLLLLATKIINGTKEILITLAVVVFSFSFHSAKEGIVNLLSGVRTVTDGFAGAFADNNSYALAAAALVPLVLMFAMISRWRASEARIMRMALYFVAFGNSVVVIQSSSRGAFIALFAGVIIFIYRTGKGSLISVFVAIALPLALLSSLVIPDGYFERLNTISEFSNEAAEQSMAGRLHFWRLAFPIVWDYPLGVGFFNFGNYYDLYDDSGGRFGISRPVHNSHLQMLVEGGILGFAGWVVAATGSIRGLFRHSLNFSESSDLEKRTVAAICNGLLASLIAFLVGATFGNYAYNDLYWVIVMVSYVLIGHAKNLDV